MCSFSGLRYRSGTTDERQFKVSATSPSTAGMAIEQRLWTFISR
jgi:hypothetical protein